MTYWKRTDYFICGHTYKVDHHGRNLHIEKCPQCNVGDYQYSSIETDEKEQPESRPQPEYNPEDGTWTFQGTPIQPPVEIRSGETVTITGTNMGSANPNTIRFTEMMEEDSLSKDIRSLYSGILSSGSSYTEVIPEGHPLPSSSRTTETCPMCQESRRVNHGVD